MCEIFVQTFDEGGKLVSVLSYAYDISAQHQTAVDNHGRMIVIDRAFALIESDLSGRVHRGRGVPLVDLHQTLGLPTSAQGGAFTVLASLDGNQAGFMVDELCAVERSSVQRLRDAGSDRAMGRIAQTIKTPDGACSVIDLYVLIGGLVRVEPVLATGTTG